MAPLQASSDGTCAVWDLTSGKQTATLRASHPVMCVDTCDSVVMGGSNDKVARVWDVETERERSKLAGHGGKIYSCCLFGNGRKAVRATHSHTTTVTTPTHRPSHSPPLSRRACCCGVRLPVARIGRSRCGTYRSERPVRQLCVVWCCRVRVPCLTETVPRDVHAGVRTIYCPSIVNSVHTTPEGTFIVSGHQVRPQRHPRAG